MTILDDLSFQLYSARIHGRLEQQFEMLAGARLQRSRAVWRLLRRSAGLQRLLDQHGMTAPTAMSASTAARGSARRGKMLPRPRASTSSFAPAPPPGERDRMPRAGARSGANSPRSARACRSRRHALRLAQPSLGIRQGAGRQDVPRADLRPRRPTCSGESDVAWIVRGGADPGAESRALRRPARGRPRQGHRAGRRMPDEDGWADVGHGTLDWQASVGTICRTPASKYFVAEHDKPNDVARSPAARGTLPRPGLRPINFGIECKDCRWLNSASASSAAAYISGIYLQNMPPFAASRLVACADISPERSAAKAAAHGIADVTPDEIMKRDDVDIVVNITPPLHFDVSQRGACPPASMSSRKSPSASISSRAATLVAEADRRGLKIRLRARHLPRRRRTPRARAHRRRQGRERLCGHVLPDVARHGALASRSRILLQAGRRTDPRHRPYYLTRSSICSAPWKACVAMTSSASPSAFVTAEGPRKGQHDPGRDADHVMALLDFATGADIISP